MGEKQLVAQGVEDSLREGLGQRTRFCLFIEEEKSDAGRKMMAR